MKNPIITPENINNVLMGITPVNEYLDSLSSEQYDALFAKFGAYVWATYFNEETAIEKLDDGEAFAEWVDETQMF